MSDADTIIRIAAKTWSRNDTEIFMIFTWCLTGLGVFSPSEWDIRDGSLGVHDELGLWPTACATDEGDMVWGQAGEGKVKWFLMACFCQSTSANAI